MTADDPGARIRLTAVLRATMIGAAAATLGVLFLLCRGARLLNGSRALDRLFARAAARACRLLGPTFVKSAQICSTRPDLLPTILHAEFARLRHSVASRPFVAFASSLPAEIGAEVAAGRLHVDPLPFASGSIACVFAATDMSDGRRLALKIRRPGLRARIQADFRIMKAAAALGARLPPLRTLPLVETLVELETLVLAQTDFAREAANVSDFHRRYRGWSGLCVPELCERFSRGPVLAMSYIPDLDPDWMGTAGGDTTRKQVELATEFLFDMVFIAGRVHADLHPGNLIFRADGMVVALDFGMVSEMPPAARRMFVYFFFGLITNSPGMCTHVLLNTALGRRPSFDEATFSADVASLIGRYTALNAAEYEVAGFIGELFALQRVHGLRPSPDFLTTVLAFLMLEGTVKALAPDYDFQGAARTFILQNGIRSRIFAR